MTRRPVTCCFSLQSPWSYLGHAPFMDLVARHALDVIWKPVDLLALFPQSGGLPLAKRHPKRQAYRDIELQRWRLRRNVPLNLRPAFWPIDIGPADRTVIALCAEGRDPEPFIRKAFAALWAEERNLADPATIAALLDASGHDSGVIEAAQSQATLDRYARNTAEALDAGVFGAPTYLLDSEPFWGQDRLALLDDALSSGRTALRVP